MNRRNFVTSTIICFQSWPELKYISLILQTRYILLKQIRQIGPRIVPRAACVTEVVYRGLEPQPRTSEGAHWLPSRPSPAPPNCSVGNRTKFLILLWWAQHKQAVESRTLVYRST